MATVVETKKLLGYIGRWDYQQRKNATYFMADLSAFAEFLHTFVDEKQQSKIEFNKTSITLSLFGRLYKAHFKEPTDMTKILELVNSNFGDEQVQISFGPIYKQTVEGMEELFLRDI